MLWERRNSKAVLLYCNKVMAKIGNKTNGEFDNF